MDQAGRFKRALLQLLQTGAYREIFGCKDGESGVFEFILQRVYRIRFFPRRIMLYEREEELVRRRVGRRWRLYRPITFDRGCVVIGRDSGEIVPPSSLGGRRTQRSCVRSNEGSR